MSAVSTINFEEIKKSNDLRMGKLLDFEKYKKHNEKYEFLKRFVEDINKNKLFAHILTQMEYEFILKINDYLNENTEIDKEDFTNRYKNIINCLNDLVKEVKLFPKNKSHDKTKNLRIEDINLETLSFMDKRFSEIQNCLNMDKENLPRYIIEYFNIIQIEKIEENVTTITPKELYEKHIQVKDIEVKDIDENPECFLGEMYLVFNCIDPKFIDEMIIYFINFALKQKLINKIEEEKEQFKISKSFAKVKYRYNEVLKDLA